MHGRSGCERRGNVASPEALNTEDGDDEYRNKPGRGPARRRDACHSLQMMREDDDVESFKASNERWK